MRQHFTSHISAFCISAFCTTAIVCLGMLAVSGGPAASAAPVRVDSASEAAEYASLIGLDQFFVGRLPSTSRIAIGAPAIGGNIRIGDPASPAGRERFRTAQVDGRWQIVDGDRGNSPVTWQAVNVRTDQMSGSGGGSNDLDGEHVSDLAQRFNAVRLGIHWDQMEPSDNGWNRTLTTTICRFLDHAATAAVAVILDPVHLSGDDRFTIPTWAWDRVDRNEYVDWNGQRFTTGQPFPSKARSFEVLWSHSSRDVLDYYDYLMGTGGDGSRCGTGSSSTGSSSTGSLSNPSIGTHPAVAAIDLLNEPHPRYFPEGDGRRGAVVEANQVELMQLYRRLTDRVRSVRPDLMIMLGAYHGGTRHGGAIATQGNSMTSGVSFAHNSARQIFTDTGYRNMVWTAHNYFTGVGDDDGLADGQNHRGARGFGVWTEAWSSSGCYTHTSAGVGENCYGGSNRLPADRSRAMNGHRSNALGHDHFSQQAAMPFFMGEWGIHRDRTVPSLGRIGWFGSHELACDKLAAYRDIRGDRSGISISSAWWSFDYRVEFGFGIYDPAKPKGQRWIDEWSSPISGWSGPGSARAFAPSRSSC